MRLCAQAEAHAARVTLRLQPRALPTGGGRRPRRNVCVRVPALLPSTATLDLGPAWLRRADFPELGSELGSSSMLSSMR